MTDPTYIRRQCDPFTVLGEWDRFTLPLGDGLLNQPVLESQKSLIFAVPRVEGPGVVVETRAEVRRHQGRVPPVPRRPAMVPGAQPDRSRVAQPLPAVDEVVDLRC